MLIALDYDDTFTRDPVAWKHAMTQLILAGHTVIGATMRYEREGFDLNESYRNICKTIYFTDRNPKRAFLADLGVFPDVWIDDTPEFIADAISVSRGGVHYNG